MTRPESDKKCNVCGKPREGAFSIGLCPDCESKARSARLLPHANSIVPSVNAKLSQASNAQLETFGIVCFVIGQLIAIFAWLFYSPTIKNDFGEINNIGLIAGSVNAVIYGSVLSLIGAMAWISSFLSKHFGENTQKDLWIAIEENTRGTLENLEVRRSKTKKPNAS